MQGRLPEPPTRCCVLFLKPPHHCPEAVAQVLMPSGSGFCAGHAKAHQAFEASYKSWREALAAKRVWWTVIAEEKPCVSPTS